jgi:DNA-binding XRE family transcriptional regulator
MRIVLKPGVLWAYCKAQGISRNEAARRIGVSAATGYRIDEQMVDPSPKFIAGLISVTGQRFEELFDIVTADESAA